MSRFKRIKILLRNHPELMDFLFSIEDQLRASDYESNMRSNASDLIKRAGVYSHGEKILVTAAISIWNGDKAKINLEECISILDGSNLSSLCQAILGSDTPITVADNRW